jgi:trehalose-6-phosphate synthase
VAALSGLNYSSFIWIGWPGIYIDQAEERAEVRALLSCASAWLTRKRLRKFIKTKNKTNPNLCAHPTTSAQVEKLLLEQNCMPVWMSADVVDGYYNGFANGTLSRATSRDLKFEISEGRAAVVVV